MNKQKPWPLRETFHEHAAQARELADKLLFEIDEVLAENAQTNQPIVVKESQVALSGLLKIELA